MVRLRGANWLGGIVVALAACVGQDPAQAQFNPTFNSTQFELSGTVDVGEADAATNTHLQRVREFCKRQQWAEAIDVLGLVMESHAGRVVLVESQPYKRYVAVREYCHLQLAGMPAEALVAYRDRVDPQAEALYESGLKRRDPQPLKRLLDEFYCSRWGDDALLRLGEWALERADYGAARGYWSQLHDFAPPPGLAAGDASWRAGVLHYPDSDIPRADVLARLVLVSIVERSEKRAEMDFKSFRDEFPRARGRLGGREGVLVELLDALRADMPSWPREGLRQDWPTFAGAATRNGIAAAAVDVAGLRWKISLPTLTLHEAASQPRPVAEGRDEPLSYFPVVAGNLLLVNTGRDIRAYNLQTGLAAWGTDPVIYRGSEQESDGFSIAQPALGTPRFTLTVSGHLLFARLGDPVTGHVRDSPVLRTTNSYLVCLDLARQGSLLWDSRRYFPLDDKWAFDGSPISDGDRVYVALRKSEWQPQAHVACLDARTGRPRWQRFVASAATPGQGMQNEVTHNLLSLDEGTLFFSTNLGAIAALAADDGRPRWVTVYPRAGGGDLNMRATHFLRDLTPCVCDRGVVYAAPSDTVLVMALDMATGRRRWEVKYLDDAVHLLGVAGGNLVASGDKLWCINVATGKAANGGWPDQPASRGYGRGLLLGDVIYWPTLKEIFICDQRSGVAVRQAINLPSRASEQDHLHGGNLLAAGDALLVVTGDTIFALDPESRSRHTPRPPAPSAADVPGSPDDTPRRRAGATILRPRE